MAFPEFKETYTGSAMTDEEKELLIYWAVRLGRVDALKRIAKDVGIRADDIMEGHFIIATEHKQKRMVRHLIKNYRPDKVLSDYFD